ncbi:MAG: ferrous iron transport protein B [Flavobacteriales bacterium]
MIKKNIKVALAGNPNSGKSTLFNALTGLNQSVGNYPGITVDKKLGNCKLDMSTKAQIIDLPGAYSLYSKSLDEKVTQQILCNKENQDYPDVIVVVADSSNLRKSLLFLSQIIDLKREVILALNMIDISRDMGIVIDIPHLSDQLGINIVEINARKRTGIKDLKDTILSVNFPKKEILNIKEIFPDIIENTNIIREDDNNYASFLSLCRHYVDNNSASKIKLEVLIKDEKFIPSRSQAKETVRRYKSIDKILYQCIGENKALIKRNFTKKIDDLLLHPILGYTFFLLVLFLIFQAIFSWSQLPMEWIDSGFSSFSSWVANTMNPGVLNDLIVNGILAGLGGIIIFVPQIAFLFAFIVFLEDTGYMARVSFIMDKILRGFGLNGRSIIPLLSGAACAVPAIMSARTISSSKERLITIFVVPLMSCSARLPVYTLIISMMIPETASWGPFNMQGLVMMAFYLLGFIAALITAFILKFIIKAKERGFYVMEIPSYKIPDYKTVLYTIVEKVKVFLFDAGKVIIAISIVLWVLSSYAPSGKFEQIEKDYASVENPEYDIQSKKLEASYAGIIGKTIEPVIKPLGFDWRIGISLITSFAAREVFVGTMSTIYSVGGTDNYSIKKKLKSAKNLETGKPFFTTAVGISLMLFYAFAMQCMTTIAVVYRETKGWKWPLIQLVYMTGLAYISSFVAYNLLS